MEPVLSARNVSKSFGEVRAVDQVSLDLYPREILGIIGPNGSGKTTFVNIVNGLYSCDGGSISLYGQRIDKLSTYTIASRGIARTFQVTKVFKRMTVLENMWVGSYISKHKNKSEVNNKALELLKLVGLTGLQHELAQNLSGGQQKLLELARALVTDPKILILDEPFAGVNPGVKERLFRTIRKLNVDEGLICLIISHDLPSIMELCPKLVALSAGKKIAEGPTKEILGDERVIQAYLGKCAR